MWGSVPIRDFLAFADFTPAETQFQPGEFVDSDFARTSPGSRPFHSPSYLGSQPNSRMISRSRPRMIACSSSVRSS